MSKYQNGKIYKLSGNNKIYIGSTICTLSKRKDMHEYSFKKGIKQSTAWEILTDSNYTIELIENYACNTRDELLMRERYWIDTSICVNKICPILTPFERSERKRIDREKYYDRYPERKTEEYKRYYKKCKDNAPTKFSPKNPDGLNLQQFRKHLKYLHNNMK